jgi:hypothetical protein
VSTQPASEEEHAADAARRRRPRWSELCWIGVLAAIGIVQVVRGQWFDVAVYALVVTMLAADATGLLPDRTRARSLSLRAVVITAVVWGVVVMIAPRHGPVMMAVQVVIGISAVVLAWPGRRAPDTTPWPRGLRRLAWAWAILVIAGCVWELGEFIAGLLAPRAPSEALSDLGNPMLSTFAGKAAFVIVWVVLGAWLLRRGARR